MATIPRLLKSVAAFCGLALVLAVTGCGKESPQPAGVVKEPETSSKESSQPTEVVKQPKTSSDVGHVAAQAPGKPDDVVALWRLGQRAAAEEQFVLTDWQNIGPLPDTSVLSLSEEQYVSLSPDERSKKDTEIRAYMDSLRNIARQVSESGRAAAAAGDEQKAKRNFYAVLRCGEFLTGDPKRVKIVSAYGKGFIRAASQDLGNLSK